MRSKGHEDLKVSPKAKVAAEVAVPGKELLVDGGFEQAKVADNSWTHQAQVGGWKSSSEIEVWGQGFYGIKATEGRQFVELDYDNRESNIYQDVQTEAGIEYAFTFDSMKRPDSKQGSDTILVFWNGKEVGRVEPGKDWAKTEFKVTGTGGNDRIEFREEAGDNDSYGGLIDNASLKSTGRVEREQAKKAAAEKAAAEKAAAEKAAAEKAAAEKAAAEKAAAEKAAAEKAAAEKAAAEKAAAEKAAADKAAAEKAAAEKAAADKAAADKAAADKAAADKAAADKAGADKAAADKAAADKAAADKAAADKAAAEKAAAEKVAADKAAAEKAAADKAAAEKAEAEKDHDHSDLHIGDKNANKLVADDHDSVLFGEGGNDVMVGGVGNDRMHGGSGDDYMSGGDGDDTMFGNSTVTGTVDMSKFRISEDTTAKITFSYEDAGYQNAIGVYKIGPDGSISGVQILFANASAVGSGGDLVAGVSSVDLGLKTGEKLGFFIIPDGFAQKGMASLLSAKSATFQFVDADGNSGNVNSSAELKLVQTNSSGVSTVIKSAYGTTVFHSANTALNSDGAKHVTGTVNNIDGTVKIGFEDLLGGGDKDFNDAVITVSLGTTNSALLAKESTKVATSTDHDTIEGGNGNDKLFGMAGNDKMSGGDGDDQMWGNSGDDAMHGGAGNDYISGGQGNDIISDDDGDDVVFGNSGDDTFIAGEGNDTYDGGSGFDTIDFSNAKQAMYVDLNNHIAIGMGNDTIKGVEAVIGSRFSDTLIGDKNDNVFYGGDGDDSFRGRGGADTFTGGAGKDTYNWAIKDVDAVDHITDFSKEDVLNLRDLIKGQQFASSVKVTDTTAGSVVSVKIAGTFQDVVVLDNVHGLSANEMLKSGMILA